MPDDSPGFAAADKRYMRRAIALARRGWGRTAPNPMVGAVVVRDGDIVGEGWHAEFGGPHAEVMALEAAGDRARGATVYVSLEPCSHHGKTPPCTDALLAAGVARVVIGVRDPNPAAAGGVDVLRAAGLRVDVGVEQQAALDVDPAFFHAARGADRPWVTLKLAVSLDAGIADHTRKRGWLTGPAARRAVHRWRAGADAVAVGINTALADDPLLTVRYGRTPRVPPVRVIFDRQFRLPLSSALVRTLDQAPVIVVADPDEGGEHAERARRLQNAGVSVLRAPSLASALHELRGRGIRHLFCEGGAGLGGSLLSAGAVDRLVIFQAPVLLGAGALPAFGSAPAATAGDAPRWRVVERRAYGSDLMTVLAPAERNAPGG